MDLIHLEEIGSTNDHLAKLAESGAREWTVVVADRQTSGKGRNGRAWWSPEGNLHMSILVRPEVTSRELLRLPIIASLAFVSALGASGSSLTIKWPNDVLLSGRKMAGILVESRSEGNSVQWAVVGFGVNMARIAGGAPEELSDRLAFVHELDDDLDRTAMAQRILSGMKERSGSMTGEDWDRARAEWSLRALLNTPYTFRDGGAWTEGVPVGLDVSGGLIMQTEEGKVVVYSGELEKI